MAVLYSIRTNFSSFLTHVDGETTIKIDFGS